ncbi:MAG: 4Fe-4S dicluster domain-containing protein [Prevotellaceae bacterium]|jgi:polyferredoxin|nr:4Fe-4S dicluster domain-containing protein [Prevotellaceae bacterium]
MLYKIRRVVAAVFFALITLLFLDFTGTAHLWFGWLAKAQLLPAALAVNVTVIVLLAVVTLLFGRVYCSVVCPLGVLQDGISGAAGRRRKNRFRYSPAKSWLRYGLLILLAAAVIFTGSAIVSLLDPYAAYGRMASSFFVPAYRWGNNLLSWFAERADSYAFYSTEVWVKGGVTFGVAAVTLLAVGVLAWRGGRTYCNTVCPVGSLLGLLSRFSIFRMTINAEKCKKCGLCERNCKASCIDVKRLTVDRSRCVACFGCAERCKFGAMRYAPVSVGKKKSVGSRTDTAEEDSASGMSRRSFMSIAGIFALTQTVKTVRAQQLKVDGGYAEIKDKKASQRKTPIVPPGAVSLHNMNKHCTACQLCVSACTNSVLRPSTSFATLMQPEVSYEKGYCRPDCIACSLVCPTGAILKIAPADKSAISVGKATWVAERCIVNRDKVQCNSCASSCPSGAVTLVAADPEDEKSLKFPVIDGERCTGCGACENLCPARPFSAVYVEGNVVHHSI